MERDSFGTTDTGLSNEKLIKAALLLIPFTILISLWAAWKVHYYGNLLPNSYFVKLGTLTSSARGFKYVYAFLNSYWLVPFPILLLSFSRDLLARANRLLLVLLTIAILWL